MIKVRVPATSANMGPGFDSMGIALELNNEFTFKEIEEGLSFKNVSKEFCNEDNLIYIAMKKCFEAGGYEPKGIEIGIAREDVPVSRGLGSSSTCIVGGLVGANKIMDNKFTKEEILEMAVEIEGHPDNVAPAVLGGMVISVVDNGKVLYEKIDVSDKLKFVPIIPDFKLSTEESRNVLPKEIPFKDGVFNVSRAALLVSSMINGDFHMLKTACNDAFHEKYRGKLIKNFDEVKENAYKNGALASYLSGAGSTIMAINDRNNDDFCGKIKEFLKEKNLDWDVYNLNVDKTGAKTQKGEN